MRRALIWKIALRFLLYTKIFIRIYFGVIWQANIKTEIRAYCALDEIDKMCDEVLMISMLSIVLCINVLHNFFYCNARVGCSKL